MSTPVSSPPLPQLPPSTSTSTHSTTSLPPSHPNSTNFVVKAILFVSSLVILCVSLIFAVLHWEHLRSVITWNPHRCTVISPVLQSNPSDSSRYRVTAQVTGLPIPRQSLTAYYGPTSDYNLSQQQAQKALNTIQTNSTCYLSDQSPPYVSLQLVSTTRSNSSYIAWAATFTAAVMGVIQLNFFAHFFHKFMTSHLPSSSPHVHRPQQVKSSFLTSQQTAFICHTYVQDLNNPHFKDWACSICLDEHSETSSPKGVKLPCQHVYHRRCIQEWLRKGKSVCPLCNWDVKSVFKQTSPESMRDSEELDLPESTNSDSQPSETP